MSVGDFIRNSQVWKSVFRHEYQDTYRNRVLQVSSNVFLHLHPTKIRRHALRLRFTPVSAPAQLAPRR